MSAFQPEIYLVSTKSDSHNMPSTYTQLYIHIIFAVAERERLIPPRYKEQLYRYITGIIHQKKQRLMAINGMPDHVHLLVSMTPDVPLSELVRDIKANSSRFINAQQWLPGRFAWQQGFGAFSYSASQVTAVAHYIEQQEQHHTKRSFQDEYVELLEKFGVEYRPEYLFDFSAGEQASSTGAAPTEL